MKNCGETRLSFPESCVTIEKERNLKIPVIKRVNKRTKQKEKQKEKTKIVRRPVMSKGKGFISEFKKFILRGNVMDMAVGVIVGGAFTSIVTSLNQDILTPILGVFGGTDFSNLCVKLGSGEEAPVLMYGNFITAVINFLITAFVIFCLVKGINAINEKMKRKEEAPAEPAAPTTKICPFCKSEIAIDATRCPHCTSELAE